MNIGVHFPKQHINEFTSDNIIRVTPNGFLCWPDSFQSATC